MAEPMLTEPGHVNRGSASRIDGGAAAHSLFRLFRPHGVTKESLSMKKTLSATLLALGAALVAMAPVHAATDAQKDAAVAKWQSMTPEEKAAAKAKAKAKWDAMTPEEQAAAKKQFAEKHPQAAKKLEAKKAAGAASAP